jgi:rod shape-determining protein MreC
MRSLLRFLVRYNFQILFLILELLALLLIIRHNPIPHSRIHTSIQALNGFIFERSYSLRQFLNLKNENDLLARENSKLRGLVIKFSDSEGDFDVYANSSDMLGLFEFVPARVVNNSVNRQSNYLTLDKGTLSGIFPDMAVVAPDGIVGVVRNVSAHYAIVIPVLNKHLQVSVVLKNSEYFGSLIWDGKNYREAIVNEIPSHVELEVGDTLLTSGYSAIFPPGEMVGTIKSFKANPGGGSRSINISLSTDFKKLSRVYVIHYRGKEEREEIESLTDEQ